MTAFIKNIFVKLRCVFHRLSRLIEPVPPEYKEQFEQFLLRNSVFRLRFLSVFLLCNHVVKKILLTFSIDTYGLLFSLMSAPDSLYNDYIEHGFLFMPLLFLVFTAVFSKRNNRRGLWLCCYLLVLYYYSAALLNLYCTDSTLEILSLYTVILFLILFVPDFKLRLTPFLLFYLVTALITSRLSVPYVVSLQYVLFFIFAAVCVVKISYYNGKMRVFVDALQMKDLNEKLESLSVTDELTKLSNRRAFMNYFEVIWKQTSRLRFPVNALMIDIDFFKKYNDTLGHLEGDKALAAVAACLKNQVKRETDFVARFGGEEFVCLLPYIDKEDAEDFAKKLVQSIENLKIHHPKNRYSPYLTISVGVASAIPNEKSTQAQLLTEADKALYMAKQTGRNRVVTN